MILVGLLCGYVQIRPSNLTHFLHPLVTPNPWLFRTPLQILLSPLSILNHNLPEALRNASSLIPAPRQDGWMLTRNSEYRIMPSGGAQRNGIELISDHTHLSLSEKLVVVELSMHRKPCR